MNIIAHTNLSNLRFRAKLTLVFVVTLLSLFFINLPAAAEAPCDDRALCDESPETACAEQCAIDRHDKKDKCEILYDVGLCFGLLSCIDDTEYARRQCINMANIIFSGCAYRCYRKLLENEVGE